MGSKVKTPVRPVEVRESFTSSGTPLDGSISELSLNEKFLAMNAGGYNPHPHQRGSSGGQANNAASESWKKHRDRIAAMWDARDLCQYDWIGGVMGRIAIYVVGELMCKSDSGDPDLDAMQDEIFHNWCGDEADEDGFVPCDLTGRHRLKKLIQMAFLAQLVDGDHALVPWLTEQGVKLQSVEADRIGSPLNTQQSETYIGGFTIDPETGKPVSIRVYNRTRHGQYNNPVEVEPQRFIHFWDPDRSDQYRGVTALLRLLNDCRDIREVFEADKIAIKDQSQYVGAEMSKMGRSRSDDKEFDGVPLADGTKTRQAKWGQWLRLGEGESVNFLTPTARPSGAWLQFVQTLIRRMAVSLKLSYGFVWDLATLGGVTARVEVRADERTITHWQKNLIIPLNRIRRQVLDYAVAMGDLPPHPNQHKCTWHFGRQIITDAGYEVQNDVSLLNAGLVAADDVATKYSDTGGSLRDVLQRNANAVLGGQQIASDTRVPLELLAPQLWPNATQLLAASNTEPVDPPPPEPGSLEAIGEKAVQQVLDLLEAVATGMQERESAIQTLIHVYGYPPEKAELITPEKMEQPAGAEGGDESGGDDSGGSHSGSSSTKKAGAKKAKA